MKHIKILIATIFLLGVINSAFAGEITIDSNKQEYDAKRNLTTASGNVNVNIDNEVNIKSPKAYVDMGSDGKPGKALFTDGTRVIRIKEGARTDVKSEILRYSLIDNEAEAFKNVETKMTSPNKPAVTITADYQSFNTKTNKMHAQGKVKITYNDIVTNSKTADIVVNSNGEVDKVILTGDAKIIQTKVTVTGHRITLNPETEVLTSEGGAYTAANMDGSIVHIWANFQEFDNKAGAMMGVGKVKIRYKSYLATGPKAVMVPDKKGEKPNRVIFNGRSTITEDNKSIQADHIEITMNPKNFTAEGNVKTRLRNLSSMDNKGRGR